jgi:hypothetical protein
VKAERATKEARMDTVKKAKRSTRYAKFVGRTRLTLYEATLALRAVVDDLRVPVKVREKIRDAIVEGERIAKDLDARAERRRTRAAGLTAEQADATEVAHG